MNCVPLGVHLLTFPIVITYISIVLLFSSPIVSILYPIQFVVITVCYVGNRINSNNFSKVNLSFSYGTNQLFKPFLTPTSIEKNNLGERPGKRVRRATQDLNSRLRNLCQDYQNDFRSGVGHLFAIRHIHIDKN